LKLDVALIQTRTPDTQAAAWAELEPLIREAAADGARLILTPEGSNLLQRDRTKLFAALRTPEDDPVVRGAGALARELGVHLLLGSALVREAGAERASNLSMLFDDTGKEVARYAKMHLFDVDLPSGERVRESEAFAPGDRAVTAQTLWGGLGMTVCYDLRFPQLYRQLAQAGARMLAVPAAFTRPTGEAHWEVLLRARAIETGSWVLAPAQGGVHADGRGTWGRSMIVDPWGAITARAEGDDPGIVKATIDLEPVDRARAAIPSLRHDREFAGP